MFACQRVMKGSRKIYYCCVQLVIIQPKIRLKMSGFYRHDGHLLKI